MKHAIVRIPSKNVASGLTTVDLGKPDYSLFVEQHKQYIQALQKAQVDVTILPACEQYPDAVFVEDVAVLSPDFAVLTKPGAPSRQGETAHITQIIHERFPNNTLAMQGPGSLEGGDVILIDKSFYIGLSERTNAAGIDEFSTLVTPFGYEVTPVKFSDVLHLKTGASYLGDNTLLAGGSIKNHPAFAKYKILEVADEEWYAANCVRANDYVLLSKGFAKTKQLLLDNGFSLLEIDSTEFRKIDGSLTCLSLRY